MSRYPDKKYIDFIKTIGSDVKNIKLVENFLTKEDLDYLHSEINKHSFDDWREPTGPSPWDGMVVQIGEGKTDFLFPRLINKIKESYGVDVKLSHKQVGRIMRWHNNERMPLHVDDYHINQYHMATIMYLNSDFEGGEIVFPKYNFSHKPKMGDMLMFPSNKYYRHEVLPVTSGKRLTLSIWFSIMDSEFSGLNPAMNISEDDYVNTNWEDDPEYLKKRSEWILNEQE